jgi:hypothetical protein
MTHCILQPNVFSSLIDKHSKLKLVFDLQLLLLTNWQIYGFWIIFKRCPGLVKYGWIFGHAFLENVISMTEIVKADT